MPEQSEKPDADAFGRSLGPGLGINLLVTDVDASVAFQMSVLEADVVYAEDDVAIMTALGST